MPPNQCCHGASTPSFKQWEDERGLYNTEFAQGREHRKKFRIEHGNMWNQKELQANKTQRTNADELSWCWWMIQGAQSYQSQRLWRLLIRLWVVAVGPPLLTSDEHQQGWLIPGLLKEILTDFHMVSVLHDQIAHVHLQVVTKTCVPQVQMLIMWCVILTQDSYCSHLLNEHHCAALLSYWKDYSYISIIMAFQESLVLSLDSCMLKMSAF